MSRSKRLTRWVAAVAVACAAVGAVGGTSVTDGTSNTRQQAGFSTSPGTRQLAGISTSPGRTLARKAGGTHVEYLAIPGVRGNGGGGTS